MKIRLRLTVLLGCLLGIFGVFACLIRESHQKEIQGVLVDLKNEREVLLDQLLVLTGQSLENFSTDYAHWDEMVHFLQNGDRNWALVNIDESMVTFDAQYVWLLKTDGTIHYSSTTLPDSPTPTLPDDLVKHLALSSDQQSRHFFWDSPAGLLEVRTCAVLPSDFRTNPSPTFGWWCVARVWNEQKLQNLASLINSRITLNPCDTLTVDPLTIYLKRQLPDWQGHAALTLCAAYEPTALLSLFNTNSDESLLFYAFSLTILLLTVLALSRWVIGPLKKLEQSLKTGSANSLTTLRARNHEFGHLARLVEDSFVQRDILHREIAERQKAEQDLHQSKELHSRLARDLHDGVIQSIYATGLGLENMRTLLHTDPAAAEKRLDVCLNNFNQTIATIRNFISGLEPPDNEGHTFSQSMTALVQTMRGLQPTPIVLSIDPRLAGPLLNETLEIQLLQIVREALSNALRHSGASSITITLTVETADRCRLVIADDGQGFDLPSRLGTGHGLGNLTTRARELDSQLVIDTAPAKGTRLSVSFKHFTGS